MNSVRAVEDGAETKREDPGYKGVRPASSVAPSGLGGVVAVGKMSASSGTQL